MVNIRKHVLVPLAIAIMVVSVTFITGIQGQNVSASSSPSQLTIGIVGTPSDPFNPMTQIALIDHWIQSVLYGTLVTYNSSGAVVPYLASSYNISSNGLTYNFVLNHNIKWSDGQPLTAADVVFTLNASIQYSSRVTSLLPFAKVDNATFSHYTLNTSTVSTPNNYTIILHTQQPNPQLLAFFSSFFYILPKHIDAGQNLTTNTYVNDHVVTSGPWYLASSSDYKPGSYIVLTANPYFFMGKPKIQKLVLEFFQTSAAAETALSSGTIQMMNNVPSTDVSTVKSAGFNVFNAPEMRVLFLQYNMNKNLSGGAYNPLSNQTVREALGYATNITALVNSISSGTFKVWGQAEPYGMNFLGYPAWNKSLPDVQFPYNTSMADKLFNASGYIWNPGSYRLNITLITLATIPYFVVATQILKSEWAQVGVNLNVKLEQTTAWVYDSFQAPQPKTWNIDLYDLTEPVDPFYPVNFLFGPGGGNAGNFTNAAIQTLIYNTSNTGNPVQRTAVFQKIDGIANKYTPYLFLATETEVDAWSTSVSFHDGLGGIFNLPLSLYAMNYISKTSAPPATPWALIGGAALLIIIIIVAAAIMLSRKRKGKAS